MTRFRNKAQTTARLFALLLSLSVFSSCSVSYYSEQDSTLHVFGIGHLAMRVPDAEQQTVYHQQYSYGLAIGSNREGAQMSLGYTENTVLDIANNESLCFEWPSAKLIQVKLGHTIPQLPQSRCLSEND